jgi:predicted molibdopterin-dependent oxidoreductase YjgC
MSDKGLRIKGIKRSKPISFFVNGKEYPAFEGETVFGALYAAGIKVMGKRSYDQQERCGFCGMGLCYECLVTINGRKNQQACMINVEQNMEVIIDAD